MASSLKKEFTISSYELNPRRQVRLTTMANFFQEIAHHHANELNFGYEVMKKNRTMWLLSRMKIRMDRYPEWNDRIMIETWPCGVDKLFFIRDFRVTNDSGTLLVLASSYWLIVSLDTHRPVRAVEELERYVGITYDRPVFESGLEKIELSEKTEMLDRHRVLYSDLDIVGHVNNVKYMEWCIDAAMKAEGPDREIGEFEINYMQEAHFGEEITIFGNGHYGKASGSNSGSGPLIFTARKDHDDKEVFRARLAWKGQDPGQPSNPS